MQDKAKLLEILNETPLIQPACQKAGVSRATYYRWRKEDKNFKKKSDEAINQGRLLINDLAESKLISQIKNENMTAIIYWLKHNHKNYIENRVDITEPQVRAMIKEFEIRDMKKLYTQIIEMFASGKINRANVNSLVSILKNNSLSKDIEINRQQRMEESLDDLAKIIDEFSGPNKNENDTDSSSRLQ